MPSSNKIECVMCFKTKGMYQSWKDSWQFLTTLFGESNAPASRRFLQTDLEVAAERDDALERAQGCLWMRNRFADQRKVVRSSTILLSDVAIFPTSAQIREELQRFARMQEDDKDTRYHTQVMEKVRSCSDSCVV